MTFSMQLRARQGRAGRPLNIGGTFGNDDIMASFPYVFVGVTATGTPPTTFANFAYTILAPIDTAFWPIAKENSAIDIRAGTYTRYRYVRQMLSKIVPLDANFVAGRYLWLVGFDTSATPAGSDPVSALSNSYHIL